MKTYNKEGIIKLIKESIPDFKYEIIETKEEKKTAKITINNKSIFLHSKFFPIKEAKKQTAQINNDFTAVIVAGFGLGYYIEELFNKTKDTKILILEKNIQIINLALQINKNLEKILNSERIYIFTSQEKLLDTLSNISTKKVQYIFHRPSFEIYQEFYSNFKTKLLSFLQKKNINIATLSRFEKLWAKNIIKNIKYYINDTGVNIFYNKFKNKPFVLVGAGPSFEENIDFLKENQHRIFIVAVDSIINTLLKKNITPDFILSVDPQIINYYFFYLFRKQNPDSILIYEPSVNFLIPKNYKKRCITFESIFPIIQWLKNFIPEKGTLDMGGSVSTTAFDFILKAGGNPIFLIGQDMAFLYNKTHSKGCFAEYYLLKKNNKYKTLNTLSYKLSDSNVLIKVKSNSGNMVNTDRRLLLFYWWFEKKISSLDENIKIYNLAKFGAYIKGTTFLIQDEAKKIISSYPELDKNIYIEKIKNNLSYSVLEKEINQILEYLNSMKKLTNKAIELSNNLYNIIKTNQNTDINLILEELNKIDADIEKRKRENEFISITMQKTILSILEDYEDFLTEKEKKNNKLAITKKSILMYSEMKKSIEYNINLFSELKKQILKL